MSRRVRKQASRSRKFPVIIVGTTLLLLACISCWAVYQAAQRDTRSESTVTLEIAFSPEKQELFEELVKRFNAGRPRTPSGKRITVVATAMEPEAMISAALAGRFQALCPDSSIWFTQLDSEWLAQQQSESPLVGETTRFAVSPVVIAMWADVARSLGYPGKAIGWADLLQAARTNPNFKWSHPSTSSASGLLATLATFYAGANKTRGLTIEDVTAESTIAYVSALEKTVRYYGEGERAVIQQVAEKGHAYLDAFIVQEQLLIQFNLKNKEKLVAIYPVEGTMWADHPLAFLERSETTAEQRMAYRSFRDFLLSPDIQALVLAHGYRPTDLSIALDTPNSPIKAENGVDPTQPKTTLQIPGPSVIEIVREVWQYTKRKTNVYLVADVSGSMQGEKLEQAREAFLTFLDSIKGEQERVGLIMFSSDVYEVVPLAELATNRQTLRSIIADLSAGGDTSLLDAINLAYERLQQKQDRERINAIVVMTDGKENDSQISLRELTNRLRQGNASGLPVVVFCVAYGDDADLATLEKISAATGGQTRRGTPETIRELYKLLSTYF
ncbi:MAG: VWA domain-containing protein [Chloroflexi bacterium]|nr:VWA domain-containing protein [Chloroflexota bacterium]